MLIISLMLSTDVSGIKNNLVKSLNNSDESVDHLTLLSELLSDKTFIRLYINTKYTR